MRKIALLFLCWCVPPAVDAAPLQIRVATFNTSLNRDNAGQLATDLSNPANNQARRIAEIIQRVHPDILLVNEFDYDAANPTRAVTLFHDNFLAVSQNGQPALNYPYRYAAPSNTGVPTGKTLVGEGDFDNSGAVVSSYPAGSSTTTKNRYGNDCYGFGWFPGQYSFAVYSRFPIQTAAVRSFQKFLWKDMPGAVYPVGYYTAAELSIFRLSSKNHVDLPIEVKPGHVVHLLASHPTPPSFDGNEDRNGRRNHDEIRLWADYISNAPYLRDDAGVAGGLAGEQRFIVLGDMNADPLDGDSYLTAIDQLRTHPLVNVSVQPGSEGGAQAATLQGGVNAAHRGSAANDTSDFYDGSGGAGNLRVDHVLPSKAGFAVTGGGVFWPPTTDAAGYGLLFLSASQTQSNQTTDHRMVWLDLNVLPIVSQAVRGLAAGRQGSDVVLTWGAQAGVTYRVETSTDLVTWITAPGVVVTIDPGTLAATATEAGAAEGAEKYYRVVCSLEP